MNARITGMSAAKTEAVTSRWLNIVFWAVVALALGKAMVAFGDPITRLAGGDNDDILRYLQVKAWLEGQPWYDARMYRMLAPEGLDLHWSRYVDLCIALLSYPFLLVMPMEQALGVGIVLWPTLLFVALLWLTRACVTRCFDAQTAIVALCAIALWQPLGAAYFTPTRIDHHNIQILLTTALTFTLIMPGRPAVLGLLGGVLAGFSLAIGLELLVTIALVGIVMALRAVFDRASHGTQLLAFCAAFACSALLFFAGQTRPEAWLTTRCDVLSPPFLTLTIMGAAIALIYWGIARKVQSPAIRLAALLGMSAGGIAVLYPLIQPCFSGPYGALPETVRRLVFAAILEARPALERLMAGHAETFHIIMPPLIAVLVSSGVWVLRILSGAADRPLTRRLGILLIFGWLGVIACLWQTRLILMGAAVYPTLIGFSVIALHRQRSGKAGGLATLALILAGGVMLFAPVLTQVAERVATDRGQTVTTSRRSADTCRDPDMIRSLSAVSSARIFATANISPPMMLLTDHVGLTGLYHRSPAATADGIIPFMGDERALREALARTKADYLLLCRDATFWREASFATALAKGLLADGFTPVIGIHEELILLKVEP